ncbi:MAG TPA: ATP-binding protein [Beijerinckiaceae bacterium]|jgi:two-component system cell cycle sensor histidine kinase/response regulator CckA|nr:ATP-binding protein [Beijerinckiaceae bacterium]
MSDMPAVGFDRPERSGSPGLVVALAVILVVVVGAFSLLPRDDAQRLILAFLALLAVVGVFALFALAVGFVQFAGHGARNDLTKLLADTSTEGLLVTEGETQPIYANDAYMALSDARNPAELRLVDRLFSGTADVSEAVYRLALAAREGKRCTEELRLSPPLLGDGPVAWYRVRVRPIERPGGKRATLWSVADITRERERHENVFQELQHAIDFLDHAPAGFFSADAEGRISYMNATLAGWLDYDLAQVGTGGLALSDLIAGNGAALLAAVAGSPGDVRTEVLDVDLKRRNGQSLPVRLLHRVAFGQDATPGISRTLVLNRTSGEEPAEDLRAAEVRFARLFNSTPMAIAALDRDGHIVRSNAAFAKLIPQALKGGEHGRSIFSAIAERDRAALENTLADAAAGKSDIAPLDVTLSGEKEHSARLFFAASGEDVSPDAEPRVTLYALDTTEQRALQENFAQSQKMQAIGQLAGGVAHDFNNVLTAIIGFSDLLLANHRPTDPAFHDIMQIKQNANRAAGLVRQLLAFSRRQTLRPQVLQLGEVLSDLHMLLRRLVGETIELDVKHGRDLWLVKADLNQFEQVIVNLVVNARDAMPEGGKIVVRTHNVTEAQCADFGESQLTPADYVLIEIEDEGHGIPADVRDKIFEPFFTTKEVGKGTGLGLSMVYGIVKQTGGFIFVDSAVGEGTTFRIFLPRHVPDENEVAAKIEAAKPAADLTGHGTILLVEDEEAVRAFSARALRSRGYTVLEAASGLDALDVVEQSGSEIDLIVSDVVMPEMDGPTMFGELRKRGLKCRVIFVSGYAEEAFAKNLPEGEDFGFMPKPFTLKQLIEAVKANMG